MEEFLAAGMHWKIFNFVFFGAMLYFLLRKPVKEFWATRSHLIQIKINEGERLKREAQEKYEVLQKRMSGIDTETRNLITNLYQEGELERKKLLDDGEKLEARLRADAERIISQEIIKANHALKEKMSQLSMELAEKLIRENIQATDQKRFADEYVADLERRA